MPPKGTVYERPRTKLTAKKSSAATKVTPKAAAVKGSEKQAPLNIVVTSNSYYGYDGFHSYETPDDPTVDSTFTSVAAANKRVRALFIKGNPWGLSRDEMYESRGGDGPDESYDANGLLTMSVSPPDSETWVVSAKLAKKKALPGDDESSSEEDEDEDYE